MMADSAIALGLGVAVEVEWLLVSFLLSAAGGHNQTGIEVM